jgi:hypothetical protein
MDILPINGRVAIIDNDIKQAQSLIELLSKKRLPVVYYSGALKYLPDEDSIDNDIRLLFLDINLMNDGEPTNKELKAMLIPILKRIIPEKSYPYIIIYWTRHEDRKDMIENDIFVNDLPTRKPIAFLSANKGDYWNLAGEKTENFEENINHLFSNINKLLQDAPSYCHLLYWENLVHLSTGNTLHEIFQKEDWCNSANYILNKLCEANLGEHFNNASDENKIKSSLNALNPVFIDSLEQNIDHSVPSNPVYPAKGNMDGNMIPRLNEKLLLSKISDNTDISEPGVVMKVDKRCNIYDALFDNIFKNCTNKEEIKKTAMSIAVIVTPLCDYAQNKNSYDRIVMGFLIKKDALARKDKKAIIGNSEAIFMSPVFNYNDAVCAIVLDYRYFVTKKLVHEPWISILFKIRQQLLSEIQSKLSRHINRQGVMFIDE